MYKSYFTIGWRYLLRSKGYSLINVGGLAVGMTIAMLIGLWVWDELTFNTYHKNYPRLAQVLQHQTVDGKVLTGYAIPRPLEKAMRSDYANDFEMIAMSTWTDEHILSIGDLSVSKSGNFVQPEFPVMFSFRMINGTLHGLNDPSSILLSASTAKSLFGDADPMNQSLRINNTLDVKVAGVYEDLPHNSHLKRLAFIASWELYASSQEWMLRAEDRWDDNSFQMFAQIAPQADMDWVSQKIRQVRAIHSKDSVFKPAIFLHPMCDWRLRSDWQNGVKVGGHIQLVWMFGIIGTFVLLLACINFMNLSTARSERRAKEVGIRMTIGSVRGQLINQFLSESFLVVLIAFILALAATTASLQWFNILADKQIVIPWSNPLLWTVCVVFVLLTSVLAGSYPAFFLSSFRPVQTLKSSFKTGRASSLPRKVLVVVQFTVSIVLVIGTLIIFQQIQFSKNRPIGYSQEGLITLQIRTPDFQGKYDALRTELLNSGAIVDVAESSSPLTQVWNNSGGFNWPGKDPQLQSSDFARISVTHEYGNVLNWKVVQGRDFSRDYVSDSSAVILNEAAVKFMNIQDPIGMEMSWGRKPLHVIGVVKDIVVESPYRPVRPHIYLLDGKHHQANWINIKLNSNQGTHESLAKVETIIKNFAPSVPFDFRFIDEAYAEKFELEVRISKLTYIFAGFATLISCLGLIGLASFVAEQRTKEIGIRKVLGASIPSLWKALSKDFVVLVVISCLVAVPVGYYFMNNWLQKYEYRTEISGWLFILTCVGALGVTLATVSYQAIRAAMMNPVKSLRSE